MKIFTRMKLGVALLTLVGTPVLHAQETPAAKVMVVQKIAKEDGTTQLEKKEIKDSELATYLQNLKTTDGKQVEIHLTTTDGEQVRISPDGKGSLLYFREAKERAAGLTKISGDRTPHWQQKLEPTDAVGGRAILGIYPEEREEVSGVLIGSLSTRQGVAAAGLQAGDVITKVNGTTLSNGDDLRAALANHKPGDQVTVTYARAGQTQVANVTLAGERSSRPNVQRDPCRVFIGVGTSQRSGDGLHVDYIVENTPAEVSDVRAGDVILSLDNVAVQTQSELESERDKHQPGEAFTLQILRAGQPLTINSRFKTCSAEELQKAEEERQRRQEEREQWRNFAREMVHTEVQRDPCAVFIGIYTHAAPGGGRQVDGIIKGTPAAASQLQKGDIILALDDVKVHTHLDVVRERDKHQPGERFTLSVLRNGEYFEVDAQFKPCGEQPAEEEALAPVTETMPETVMPEVQPVVEPDRQLKVEEWNAYPNPTYGRVNVQFRAEAVPTTFQIIDAAGKTVYQENLNRFDGFYQKQLNLDGNLPGVYVLVVRQGEKVFYNKVVLLSKA